MSNSISSSNTIGNKLWYVCAGRIVYFMVVGVVVGGMVIVIAVILTVITMLVCRAKGAQKRKIRGEGEWSSRGEGGWMEF